MTETLGSTALPTGVVTFLMTDVVDSTPMWDRAPSVMAPALFRHDALIAEAVATHCGVLIQEKGEGDSTFSVFWRATDAVAAAVAAQKSLDAEPWPPEVRISARMAVHTGETLERGTRYYGTAVNKTARLRSLANGGEVLLSRATAALVIDRLPDGTSLLDLGIQQLRGLTRPEQAFSVIWGETVVATPHVAPPVDAESPPLPDRLTVGHYVRWVGRPELLEKLSCLAKETAVGDRRVVLISGEPGIGKTRLVTEAALSAHAGGMTVLYGRADEDLHVPYQCVVEALRHYVQHGPAGVLAAHVESHGGELTRLVPELRQRVQRVPLPQQTDADTERWLLVQAVTGLLAAASEAAPVLLALDDLQWADRNSLLLLRQIIESPLVMRLLVEATFRDADAIPGSPLVDLLAAARRLPSVHDLHLRGLGGGEVRDLVEAVEGQPLDAGGTALARVVWEETEGNPLFAQEVLRHLMEEGRLHLDGGHWSLTGDLYDLAVPPGVRDLVLQRVGRLRDGTRRTLTVAAVIGRDFDIDLLSRVTATDEENLLDALEEAVAAGMVGEVPGTYGRFTFAHALFVRALAKQMGATRRARAHRQVATALEALTGGRGDARLVELATHWAAADGQEAAEHAADYARRAGDQAMASLAHHTAVRWYRVALEALDRAGTGAAFDKCDVMLAIGEAQRQAGDPASRDTLLAVGRDAAARGDVDHLVQAALVNNRGDITRAGRVDEEKVAILEQALAALESAGGDRRPDRANVLATLALELVYAGDWRRRLALSDEALTLARSLGDADTLAFVLNRRFEATRLPNTLTSRLAETEEHLSLARQLDDPVQLAFAALWRSHAAWEAGDVGEVDRCMDVCQPLADRLGQPYLHWAVACTEPYRLLLDGHVDEAEAASATAFQIGQSTSQPDAVAVFVACMLVIRWDQDRLAELEPMVAQAVADNPGIPGFRAALAHTYCEMDRPDDARAVLSGDMANGFVDYPYHGSWLASMAYCALVVDDLGEAGAAAALHDLMRPYEGQVVFSGASVLGAVDWYLGMLAATEGRLDEAERRFATALALYERMGAEVFAARTRLSWGKALLGGEAADRRRAYEVVVSAREASRQVANTGRRAERLLAALGR